MGDEMKAQAMPNYIAPFSGWVVIYNEALFKHFTGEDAQLNAQTLAKLLNI
jgi:hypothetical protein